MSGLWFYWWQGVAVGFAFGVLLVTLAFYFGT